MNINLESNLDIATSDMLVNASAPTFQHNWQKYQGKFLPNSLRFEKNGWAAGWNVYNFDYDILRTRIDEHLFAELGSLNEFVKIVKLFSGNDSINSIKEIFVTLDNSVISGDVALNGDEITGELNGKPFVVLWDKDTKTATMDTAGFSIEQINNPDKTYTLNIIDDALSFSFDFELMLSSDLTGDSINTIKYTSFNGKFNWGNYSFDENTLEVTTPEGVTATAALIGDNTFSFDYEYIVTDEILRLNFAFEAFYVMWDKLSISDSTDSKDILVSAGFSNKFKFNKVIASVNKTELIAADVNGVNIDIAMPVWISASAKLNRTGSLSKKCNNTRNNEIAVNACLGVDVRVRVINAYDRSMINEDLIDNYRASISGTRNPQYIKSLQYRFNQILVGNTIRKSQNWSPNKYTVSKNDLWVSCSRQYSSFRNRRTSDMLKTLGNVYTFGGMTYKASEFFEQNNIWDWSNRNNCVYRKSDISNILSIKRKGDADNETEMDDNLFVINNMPNDLQLISRYVVNLTGQTRNYSLSQQRKTYDELYSADGTYIGGTYVDSDVIADDVEFWPFSRIPMFNFVDADGNTYDSIYWTNGTKVIDSLDEFKAKVLGQYSSDAAKQNEVLIENNNYDRGRIVEQYRAGYDFDYIRRDDYSTDDKFNTAREEFSVAWINQYPQYTNPYDIFDDSNTYDDTTYLDYNDIEVIQDVKPVINFVTPGVYAFNNMSVPFNAASGLILLEGDETFNFEVSVYHHIDDASNMYSKNVVHSPGVLEQDTNRLSLSSYFNNIDTQSLHRSTGDLTLFNKETVAAKLSSASLKMDISSNSNSSWLNSASVSYSERKVTINGASVSGGIEPITDASIGYYYFSKQFMSLFGLTDIDTIGIYDGYKGYSAAGSVNNGLFFAWPVLGHVAQKIKYPSMLKETDIITKTVEPFEFYSIPSNELQNPGLLYIDRDDLNKSHKLVTVDKSSSSYDTYDGKGKFSFTISGRGFYACMTKIDKDTQKEVFADYFIPGIAYGNVQSNEGNLSFTNSDLLLNLNWHPVKNDVPSKVEASFSNLNSMNSTHLFYSITSDYQNKMKNIECVVKDIEVDTAANTMYAPIEINIDGNIVNAYYDCIKEEIVTKPDDLDTIVIDDDKVQLTVKEFIGKKDDIKSSIDLKLIFKNNEASFFKIDDADYAIVSSDDSVVSISKDNIMIDYNTISLNILNVQCDVDVKINDDAHIIHADSMSKSIAALALRSSSDGTINNKTLSFNFMGVDYDLNLEDMLNATPSIKVNSTDIRDAEHTHTIGIINPQKEYQIVKQQWNATIEVENYWWIDDKHILELNQYFLILKRNTFELDDWNGDRFEKVFEISRAEILPSDIRRYFVTNVYGSDRTALFVTMKLDGTDILVEIYNPREKFTKTAEFRIQYRKREINSVLNDVNFNGGVAYLNSYKPILIENILSSADLSNTVVDNNLIIGLHLSKNFDQWSIVFNLENNTISKVIQGYGYVGLHGDLTGGMIPDKYVDSNKGFNSSVVDLKTICNVNNNVNINSLDDAAIMTNASDVNNIKSVVAGTAEQQWYIDRKIYGIVSHLKYDNGNFIKQLLPITNNFDAIYRSPSFTACVMGDILPQVSPFASIVKSGQAVVDTVWNMFMGFCGYPLLFFVAPRLCTMIYLQQTFGQYAYVHYNSMTHYPEVEPENDERSQLIADNLSKKSDKQQQPVMSSEFTFDKQKFSQNARVSTDSSVNLYFMIGLMFQVVNEIREQKTSQNEEVNSTSMFDKGKKFVENAMANIGDLLSSSIRQQSNTAFGLVSNVTGIKSLDMFYSTSDEQEVVSGPGFVEHRFVADCVAQSVTDLHVEGRVLQINMCIRALTTLQATITQKLLLEGANALEKAGQAVEDTQVCANTVGAIAAAALYASASAMRAAKTASEVAFEEIDKILDVICANGIQSNLSNGVSKHNLSVEGKHKYGEKNEVFMWPCWGIKPGTLKYTDEYVNAGVRNVPWILNLKAAMYWTLDIYANLTLVLVKEFDRTTTNFVSDYLIKTFLGDVPFYNASAFGRSTLRSLPDDMAKVEGVSNILPNEAFKNENIGVSDPVFPTSAIQDYIIDKNWDLSMCCTMGYVQWITVKDTKITNGKASNMYINNKFCGIASSYMAAEIKRGISKAYMRPWAITPNTLAMNCTGYNSILDNKLYHSFDGISYRLVDFVGSPGLGKNVATDWYSFQKNDRFKRSNICPSNEFLGNFNTAPVQAVATIDENYNLITVGARNKGLEVGSVSEDKDQVRFALPILTEHVSTLPAAVRTLSAMQLYVYEGVTSLCTGIASGKLTYKAPLSVDFTIGKQNYRVTEEYICTLTTQNAIDVVEKIIPTLGLKYIGSTPTEAYFYSESTRHYYTFTGSSLVKMEMMERFRDIQKGYWDFVNQEVVMPCLMTFKRLNKEVLDKDTETDNIIIPVMSRNTVSGELPPPITTIFNDKSWYKCVSLPCGFAYQGPNRVIINRSVFVEYMLRTMKDNLNKWKKMDREKYVTKREYPEMYTTIDLDVNGVDGWTHNPFLLVTSALGQDEAADCIFEWVITFCWPIEMDLLYSVDNFAVVNVTAETMTPGGKVTSRPTHIFLTKELFTRNSNYGYYSFKYQSKNGAGNRERLHIWSDQYIAVSSIDCNMKTITSSRTEQLTQQLDVSKMKEL